MATRPSIPQSGQVLDAKWGRQLLNWIDTIRPKGDNATTKVSDAGYITTYGESASSSFPAKIVDYDSGEDTHTVNIYANGFEDAQGNELDPTQENVELGRILNRAENVEIYNSAQLTVYKAGTQWIGIYQGLL